MGTIGTTRIVDLFGGHFIRSRASRWRLWTKGIYFGITSANWVQSGQYTLEHPLLHSKVLMDYDVKSNFLYEAYFPKLVVVTFPERFWSSFIMHLKSRSLQNLKGNLYRKDGLGPHHLLEQQKSMIVQV